jgi:hypothetical protein
MCVNRMILRINYLLVLIFVVKAEVLWLREKIFG